MSEPVRIVIALEGGLLSAICTLGVPVEAIVIDYDTEGASEVVELAQDGGTVADALVNYWEAEALSPAIRVAIEQFWPVKPVAPGEFNRAKLAGYTVHQIDAWTKPDGSQGGRWAYNAPDGGCGTGYPTERAAWEACDRHRMFGEA